MNFNFGIPKNLKDDDLIFDLPDRYRHYYILGTTGTGKTSIMERMSYYDLMNKRSIIFIDIKGEHAHRLYSAAPDKSKIVYLSKDNPLCLNPLTMKNIKSNIIVDSFIQVMDILITANSSNPETSVRMKQYITASIPFFKDEEKDISYLFKFLLDKSFREKVIKRTNDENIHQTWINYDKKTSYNLRETGESICNRLALFLFDNEFRPYIIGKNEFNVKEYIDQGKSLIFDASGFSDIKRNFLANLIIYSVYSYLNSEKSTHSLFVYIDEFQTTVGNTFKNLLETARSSKVGFILAHQAFGSIKDLNILKTIISIPDNKIIFRCGHFEAELFSKLLNVKYEELSQLPDYAAYIQQKNKIVLYDYITPPFQVKLLPKPVKENIENIENSELNTFHFLKSGWIDII